MKVSIASDSSDSLQGRVNYYLTENRANNPLISRWFTFKPSTSSRSGGGQTDIDDKKKTKEEKVLDRIEEKANDENYLAVLELEDLSHTIELDDDGDLEPLTNLDKEFSDEEINETKNRVSDTVKRFSIKVHHDPDFIPGVQKDLFQENNNAILSALKISYGDKDDEENEPENITSKFSFYVLEDTKASSRNSSKNETTFIAESDEDALEIKQRLTFKINVKQLLNKSDANLSLPANAKAQDVYNIDLKGLLVEAATLDLESTNIVFVPSAGTKKNSVLLSSKEPLIFTITLDEGSVDSINPANTTYEKSGISFSSGKNQDDDGNNINDLLLPFNLNSDAVDISLVNNTISVNIDMSMDKARNTLLKKKELFTKNSNQIFIPFSIEGENSSAIPVDISDTLDSEDINIIFIDDPKFLNTKKAKAKFVSKTKKNGDLVEFLQLNYKYSNILAAREDALELDIKFLNESGQDISGTTYTLANVSGIKDKLSADTKKVNHRRNKKLKLNSSFIAKGDTPLGAAFMTEASTAAQVQLTLRRSEEYINSLGDIVDDEITAIFNDFTERRFTVSIARKQ